MPVRPVDPQRIVTDQLHIVDNDVVGNGSNIERSYAGKLVNTCGASTLAAQGPVRIPADVAFFPDNLQVPLFCHGPNIFGRPNHQLTTFSRMGWPVVSVDEVLLQSDVARGGLVLPGLRSASALVQPIALRTSLLNRVGCSCEE